MKMVKIDVDVNDLHFIIITSAFKSTVVIN
jgi:hypothetical protein